MLRGRFFKHGKWPRWMVRLHYYTIASFILLMVTGIALFLPAIHTPLIPYLPLLYYIHIVLGIVFGLTLLLPLVMRLPLGKLIRRLDWVFPLVFGAVIVITGLFLWQVTVFPTTWRSLAFRWHGWMSYALSAWLVVHAAYKALGYRPANDGVNAQVDPSRRFFLKSLGTGLVGAAVLTIVDPVSLLTRTFTWKNGAGNSGGTSSDFAAYYTVTGGYPKADVSSYQLRVDGLVTNPMSLSWTDVLRLTPQEETVDFHCVTGWSVPNVQWKGVPIKSFVSLVKPSTEAKYVHFYSFDGAYTESLPLQEALAPAVLLAYQLNGQPLSTKQGFPLRLVVPNMYGYKSIKWVNRIEFSDQPLTGYWEVRGYADEAYVGRGI